MNKFNIKDIVFHITPESEPLIIVDYRIYSNGDIEYLVTASIDKYIWVGENELSIDKIFI